jgi:hypothetical protein
MLRTIQQESVRCKELAVHIHLNASLRILARGNLKRGVQLNPWNLQEQIGDVPIYDGQLLYLAAREGSCTSARSVVSTRATSVTRPWFAGWPVSVLRQGELSRRLRRSRLPHRRRTPRPRRGPDNAQRAGAFARNCPPDCSRR